MRHHAIPFTLALFAATCTRAKEPAARSGPSFPEDAAHPATDAAGQAPGISQVADAGAMVEFPALGFALNNESRQCVIVAGASSPCHENLEDVFNAIPDLETRARKSKEATLELARFIHAFQDHRVRNGSRVNVEERLVTAHGQAQQAFHDWMTTPDFDALDSWRADTRSEIPDMASIDVPHWEGRRFLATALFFERGRNEIAPNQPATESYLSIRASTYQIDFSRPVPAFSHAVLPTRPHSLDSHKEAVSKIFGGPVDAFVQSAFGENVLCVAIGPKKGASRYVVRSAQHAKGYASWPELVKSHPGAASAATLAELTERIYWFFTYRSFSDRPYLIVDAEAYKKTYRENGWQEEKLRYWHDEFRHTVWEIPDFDSIADPTIRDGKLITFGKEHETLGREPRRYEIDLKSLELDSKVSVTHLWKATVLEDSRGPTGPSGPSNPLDAVRVPIPQK